MLVPSKGTCESACTAVAIVWSPVSLENRGSQYWKKRVMPTLEDYRTWADQNLQRARAAKSEEERLFYLDLTRTYLREVIRLDDLMSQGLPPATTLCPPPAR
jgi:hypothetical protein